MNNEIPSYLSEKILNDIKNRLSPNLKTLLAKLFIVHLLTAIITLSICPQLGFQIFKSPINLMNIFMTFGTHFCDFACGTFFTATSIFIALFIFSRDELRVLKNHRTLTVLTLVLGSIGFFVIMNPQLFFELSLLWILGTILGASITLEIGAKLQLLAIK